MAGTTQKRQKSTRKSRVLNTQQNITGRVDRPEDGGVPDSIGKGLNTIDITWKSLIEDMKQDRDMEKRVSFIYVIALEEEKEPTPPTL